MGSSTWVWVVARRRPVRSARPAGPSAPRRGRRRRWPGAARAFRVGVGPLQRRPLSRDAPLPEPSHRLCGGRASVGRRERACPLPIVALRVCSPFLRASPSCPKPIVRPVDSGLVDVDKTRMAFLIQAALAVGRDYGPCYCTSYAFTGSRLTRKFTKRRATAIVEKR